MTSTPPSVGIVGAGSVGIMTGYDLARSGADVTYLVRPHRLEQLERPQVLYSYDDHSRHEFSGYAVATDVASFTSRQHDLVVVTLDTAAMRAEAGVQLVKELGAALRDTDTVVVLATVGLGVRPWFVEQSGMDEARVAIGSTALLIHEVARAGLPIAPTVDRQLLESSDYGFRHLTSAAFMVDDSSPRAAEIVADLYAKPEAPGAVTVPADQMAVGVAGLAPILAWGLLGWRDLATEVDPADPTWRLGVDAMQEIQRLPQFGRAGQEAADGSSAAGVLESFSAMAGISEPLDFAAFNAYHHGGKVNQQDRDLLDHARLLARAEGLDTPALDALISQLASHGRPEDV